MIFLTPWFWGFFALVLPVHFIVQRRKARLFWILLTSVVFQAYFAGLRGLPPIIALELITYFAALRFSNGGSRRWLHAAIAANVGALVFFKYLDFLSGYLFSLIGMRPHGSSILVSLRLPIPLGISFFVFEFVHYLVEVDRGMKPARSWLRFWAFASFFPSLVSGPIKRFPDFDRQLDDLPRPDSSDALAGAQRMVVGAFKKIVLAEPCHAFAVWFVANPGRFPLSTLLVALSLQIYFDFAGYSDIAIGVSRSMGLIVPENFENPYGGRNISEFWRRWHMSLSTWIRDYIYIPLGGNRVPLWRKILNGAIAMFLCGLWHGAALHFGLWGLWHALLLSVHGGVVRLRERLSIRSDALVARAASIGYHAFTVAAVAGGWLLFFFDLPTISQILAKTPRLLW
ncbi:MAG: MBOAT family protein [Elusimicrobia bacterium]|nr:MBOAT family protein [Elusimicrobiota bacterium]